MLPFLEITDFRRGGSGRSNTDLLSHFLKHSLVGCRACSNQDWTPNAGDWDHALTTGATKPGILSKAPFKAYEKVALTFFEKSFSFLPNALASYPRHVILH